MVFSAAKRSKENAAGRTNEQKDLTQASKTGEDEEHPSSTAKPNCSSVEEDSKPQTIKEEEPGKPDEMKEEEKMEVEASTSASTETKGEWLSR